MTDESTIDHELLLAEIYEEVARRRDDGEIPPDLERDLDRVFAELAPPGAAGDDGAVLVERVEQAAFIDVQVQLEGAKPGVLQVKSGLRKLMAWYMHWVTEQVNGFTSAAAGLGRSLHLRVRALEDGTVELPRIVRDELDALGAQAYPADVLDRAVDAFAGGTGRVVVAHCGDASLVRRLRSAGVDAYGVEPRRALTTTALREGLEIRATTAIEHLRALPDERVDGVLLLDVTDTSTPNVAVELVEHAVRASRTGGTVVVVSTSPDEWRSGRCAPRSDLVPGQPLQPVTWSHMLRRRGLEVTAAPASDPDGSASAARAYVVVARKPT
jgi:hypothetical protein